MPLNNKNIEAIEILDVEVKCDPIANNNEIF